jgi:fucose permease
MERPQSGIGRRETYYLVSALLIIFTCGFILNLRGIFVPQIAGQRGLSDAHIGMFYAFFALGYVLSNVCVPIILRHRNAYIAFMSGLGAMVLAIVLVLSIRHLVGVTVAIAFIGLSTGILNITGNAVIAGLSAEQRVRNFNLLHVSYGVGTFFAPLAVVGAAGLISKGPEWGVSVGASLAMVVICTIVVSILGLHAFRRAKTDEISLQALIRMMRKPVVLVFLLFAFLYGGLELGLVSWIPRFLEVDRGFTAEKSAAYLSLFSLLLTGGRLVGSLCLKQAGSLKALPIAALFALLCAILASFPLQGFSLFVPLLGLGVSIIFPTMTALISIIRQREASLILCATFFLCGCGFFVFPGVLGVLADALGIGTAFAAVSIFLTSSLFVLIIVSVIIFNRIGKK